MSKYTTQVRFLVETYSPSGGSPSARCKEAAPTIFDFNFPIWNEDYRLTLESKILLHYYTKEIAYEVYGLWKMYLEERLNLIMPYYNKLYETTIKDYDYMTDTNIKEQETANFTGTGNTKNDMTAKVTDVGSDNATTKNLESDLPQANYAGVDYGTQLNEGEATNNTQNTTDTTQNANSDITQTSNNDINRLKVGAAGGRSLTDLLLQYRDSLINIDQMIIEELADLFMNIY